VALLAKAIYNLIHCITHAQQMKRNCAAGKKKSHNINFEFL